MMSKQKKRLLKSLSHDVTSLSPQSKSSSVAGSSTSNLSTEDRTAEGSSLAESGSKDIRMVVRRDEFICSDNHHAHLEEDFLEDESRLFGRHIPSPSSASVIGNNVHANSRVNLKVTPIDVCSRNSSRRTFRKLFKSKSVDTHSVKSDASHETGNMDVEPENEVHLREVEEEELLPYHPETMSDISSTLPAKPPRKRGPSLSIISTASVSKVTAGRNGSAYLNDVTLPVEEQNEEIDQNVRPHLLRRDSVIRPLQCDPRPKLYTRHSITHVRQFSQESAMIDSDHSQPVDSGICDGIQTPISHHASKNGGVVGMHPERPQRRRQSQLVKRESVIHPARPPRQKQSTPLGPSNVYQPLIVNGRFQNPWSTWKKPSFVGSLRWTFATKDNSSVPNSPEELDKTLPVLPLRLDAVSQPPLDGIRITWLGHATVLVQLDGISVLTDPMFSERASPLGFFGPKRIRPFPGSVYDLPKLDAVIISHNHYDHLDYNSVLLLNARFGSELHWFVPVGLRTWMHNAGCETVTELTWWAEGMLHHANDVSFCFTPAQHWCKRTPTDDNKVLWGSWCILGPRYRFFFAGDTGYCDVFKQIGEQFGPFDLAAIPIGAYEPRWFMHNQHIDPSEAVKIHQDIKADKSLGIHWGTFILTNEHYLEPPLKLAECVRHAGLLNDDFFVLKHGESRLIDGS